MCYIFFRSLSCQRITLHKNLFFSYVLNSMFTIAHLIAVVPNPGLVKRDPVSIAWLLSIFNTQVNLLWPHKTRHSHSPVNDSHLVRHAQMVQILRISLNLAQLFHQAIKIFESGTRRRSLRLGSSQSVRTNTCLILTILSTNYRTFPSKALEGKMPLAATCPFSQLHVLGRRQGWREGFFSKCIPSPLPHQKKKKICLPFFFLGMW